MSSSVIVSVAAAGSITRRSGLATLPVTVTRLSAAVSVTVTVSASLTALTVTVCPVFHVVALYVSAVGATATPTAPASSLVTSTTTAPVGCPASVTVYVVLPPSVSANAPVPRLTAIVASSSISVTDRFSDAASYSSAVLAFTVVWVIFEVPPAVLASSSAMTVIVWPVFQVDVVNVRVWLTACVPPTLFNR